MAYYYLVASLPPLELGKGVPFTPESFYESCYGVVSEDDYEDMRRVLDDKLSETVHPFLRDWYDRETQLRNALARERASKRKTDAAPFLRAHGGWEAQAEKAATQAMSMENPLERERHLDRFRWDTLDEMALDPPFGAGVVFAFLLKLQIAVRWVGMTEERGGERAESTLKDYTKRAEF